MKVPFGLGRPGARGVVTTALVLGSLVLVGTNASAEPGFGAVKFLPTDVGGVVKGLEPYGSVSCPTTTSCTAAGPANQDLGGTVASVVTESSGTWGTATAVVLPANADKAATVRASVLNDVACWSVGNCAAVGDYIISEKLNGYPDSAITPLTAVETSGVWSTAVAVPLPTGNYAAGDLSSVSCDASGDCTAFGWYVTISTQDFETYHAFVTSNLAGSATWSAPVLLNNPSGVIEAINSTAISCADETDCTVAENVNIQAGPTMEYFSELVTETASVWGSPVAVGPVSKRPTAVNQLTCVTATGCVAVGYSSPTEQDLYAEVDMLPTVMVETAGSWSDAKVLSLPVVSPLTNEGDLLGVSCSSAGVCEATGIGLSGTKDQYAAPLAVSLTGGSWSSMGEFSVPLHAGALVGSVSTFTAVDCFVANCLALGDVSTGFVSSNNTVDAFSDLITPTETVKIPGRPSNVKIGLTPTKVVVAYAPPLSDGGAPLKQFVVTATSPKELKKTCVTTALSCGLVGTVKGHTYSVTVIAKNSVGSSVPTPAITFKAT